MQIAYFGHSGDLGKITTALLQEQLPNLAPRVTRCHAAKCLELRSKRTRNQWLQAVVIDPNRSSSPRHISQTVSRRHVAFRFLMIHTVRSQAP